MRKGIIDSGNLVNHPEILAFGMLASLLSAAIWLMLASWRGWPVSTTHSIVGAIVGFGVVGFGIDGVAWGKIGSTVSSWVESPLLGGILAFLLMVRLRSLIFNTPEPFLSARQWDPFYLSLVCFILTLNTLFKSLKHLNIELSIGMSFSLAV